MKDPYVIVREDLHRRYEQYFDAEAIDGVLDRVIAEAEATAKIKTFLPVLVERTAAEELEDMAVDINRDGDSRREILFVCEKNAGRSQLAANITHHLVGDRVMVRSVGLNPTGGVDSQVLQVLQERGISTDHIYQKEIVPRTVHRSNVVVLMGVDEVPGIPAVRYVHWDIEDPAGQSIEKVREIADEVEKRILVLLEEIGKAPKEGASEVA
ncbi:low molecular weight phosphatase family protein [Corynebacterium alimapuense]|uniref:Protein tyrosine phosphatase n=1 Tax=Corynebacterium alimapuense TaxID=1576874 RepID=A0A3M8K9V1_9CORY|nr:low molecular weight phosphatase family protein [Corynebacterium alimapuense]RNE49997.1 protein tyrosine phosphatase [Corynebacterium alimapuense]